VAFLTRPHRGRRTALAAEFLKGFGAAAPIHLRALRGRGAAAGHGISFGREQLPTIDWRARASR